jgi:hypothetical protein
MEFKRWHRCASCRCGTSPTTTDGSIRSVQYDCSPPWRSSERRPRRTTPPRRATTSCCTWAAKATSWNPATTRYRITYTTKGQVGFFPDHDEIYWNVNGNGWAFAIDSISALIHLPPMAQVKQTACYTGTLGSTENACSDSLIDARTVRFQGPRHGATTKASRWPSVSRKAWWPNRRHRRSGSAMPCAGGRHHHVLLLLYYFVTWSRFGRDPDMPTVIPLFEPPDNLSPHPSAMVMNGGFAEHD